MQDRELCVLMVTVMDQNWVSIVGPNLTLDALAKCMNILMMMCLVVVLTSSFHPYKDKFMALE